MKKPETAKCHYCHRLLASKDITFDHMTPKIGGGRHATGSIVFACPLCNLCKGHTHYAIFLIQISFVPVEATIPLSTKPMRTHMRNWLRKLRARGLREPRNL